MSQGIPLEQRVEALVEKGITAIRDEFRTELLRLKAEFTKVEPEAKELESEVKTEASKVEVAVKTETEKVVEEVKTEAEKL